MKPLRPQVCGALALTTMLAAPTPLAVAAAPAVQAPSAAVIEASTGTVLFAKNAKVVRPMASTTKLMTALVALDRAPLSTKYTAVAYGGSPLETRLGLRAGERMTLADLVRAMMLPSANDAALTVAVRSAGSRAAFVRLMNQRARKLGLKQTRFANPVGLDAGSAHRTTALELAQLGAAAHANPFLRATVKRTSITLKSGDRPRTIVNRNRVLGAAVSGGGTVNGMKTGRTSGAGYSLVGSATSRGVTVISVVLGGASEGSRDADTARLLKWAGGLMEERTLVREGAPVVRVPVTSGKQEDVGLVAGRTLTRAVARGAKVTLRPTALPDALEAPVQRGTQIGVARVLVNSREVERIPLRTAAAVERQGVVAAVAETVRENWLVALLAALLIVTGTLVLLTASRQRSRVPSAAPGSSSDPPAPSSAP